MSRNERNKIIKYENLNNVKLKIVHEINKFQKTDRY